MFMLFQLIYKWIIYSLESMTPRFRKLELGLLLVACLVAGCSKKMTDRQGEQEVSGAEYFVVDPASSPYGHNPVSWRYAVFIYENEETVSNFEVELVTTPLRRFIDGLGLTFTLVARIGEALDEAHSPPDRTRPVIEKRQGLITPGGLWLSGSLGQEVSLVTDLEGAASRFGEGLPTWPLPGHSGCDWEHVTASLEFGVTRAVMTQCNAEGVDGGSTEITTLWVEEIGFVYRETVVDRGLQVQRDYLVGGDLLELAPLVSGEEGLSFLPPPE